MKHLFICLFIYPALLIAQQDPLAEEVLEKVSKKVNTWESMHVSYTFEHTDLKTGESRKQSGELIMKGEKYKIILDATDIYCDGKTIWTHMKTVQEVNIINLDKNKDKPLDLTNPKNLFTFYNKNFKYDYITEETYNGRLCHKIDLYPLTLKTNYSRIRLLIDKEKNEIVLVKTFTKNGNNYIFSITSLKGDIDTPDATFTFDPSKNPGVEVIDMRIN